MMAEPLRFVQITGVGEGLYALDEDGQVWAFQPSVHGPVAASWYRCSMRDRDAIQAPSLTTVARTPDVR